MFSGQRLGRLAVAGWLLFIAASLTFAMVTVGATGRALHGLVALAEVIAIGVGVMSVAFVLMKGSFRAYTERKKDGPEP